MLKSIRTRTPLPVIDGVLIKRAALQQARTHKSMIAQAQREARAIVARAEREADAVRQYAAARGYREGMRDAWGSITPWLDRFERHCSQALDAFEQAVRTRLEDALHDPAVVGFVVRCVFDGIAQSSTRQIRIFVPAAMSGLVLSFSEWAAQAGLPNVGVVPCEDDRLAVECGDEIFLFDIKARASEWASCLGRSMNQHPSELATGPSHAHSQTNATGRQALASIDTATIRKSERPPHAFE